MANSAHPALYLPMLERSLLDRLRLVFQLDHFCIAKIVGKIIITDIPPPCVSSPVINYTVGENYVQGHGR